VVVDEEKSAKKLIARNMHKWDRFDGFEKRKKMTDYLARKGFGWDTIKSVVSVDD
jgi:SOS response regulatory protein OraA/RecX